MTETVQTPEEKATRSSVIDQLSPMRAVKRRYDPAWWLVLILYPPMLTMPLLFFFGQFVIALLEIMIVMMLYMFVYVNLSNKREKYGKGKKYTDNRLYAGSREFIEQISIKSINPVVKPGDPYPFHKTMTAQRDVEPVLRHVGVDVMDMAAIDKLIDQEIKAKAEAKMKAEREARERSKVSKVKHHIHKPKISLRPKHKHDQQPEKPAPAAIEPALAAIVAQAAPDATPPISSPDSSVTPSTSETPPSGSMQRPISVIPHLGPSACIRLKELGIVTFGDLAMSDEKVVSSVKGISLTRARALIATAESMLQEALK